MLSFFVGFTAVFAQPASWSVVTTPDTHIIFMTASINPTINGLPISVGDYIGVFYDRSGTLVCGGMERWTGRGLALSAFGNDSSTPIKDGFSPNETFVWKVWRAVDGAEGQATVSYKATDVIISHQGGYANNGISELLTLVGTVTPSGGGSTGSTTIAAPSNLQITSYSSAQVNLSFKDNSNNESGFWLLRSNSLSQPFVTVAQVTANTTTFVDKQISPNGTYYYQTLAFNTATRSLASNTVNLKVPYKVQFILSDTTGYAGSTVPISLTLNDFTSVNSIKIRLLWNSTELDLLNITDFATTSINFDNFDISNIEAGQLDFSYTNASGFSFPNKTILFKLSMKIISKFETSAEINFSDDPNATSVRNVNNFSLTADYDKGVVDVPKAPHTITVDSLKTSVICQGTTLLVRYKTTQNFDTSNFFTFELSDSLGSFSNAMYIGSKNGIQGDTTVLYLPEDLAKGKGYKIRVISSNPSVASTDNGESFEIIDTNNAKRIIEVRKKDNACYGDYTGEAEIILNCAVKTLRYQWSNGEKSSKINNLKAGTYKGRVYFTESSFYEVETTITQPAPLFLTATITNVSKQGIKDAKINLIPSGGTAFSKGNYKYEWLLPDGSKRITEDLDSLTSGKYEVIVTDSMACAAKLSLLVSEPDVLSIKVIKFIKPTCELAKDGYLEVQAEGGVPKYFFKSNTGDTASLQNGKIFIVKNIGFTAVEQVEILLKDQKETAITQFFNLTAPTGKPAISLSKTEYCLTDANPKIIVTGVQNGKLQAEDGLVIDSTGTINLAKSLAGTYKIEYITNNESCKVTPINVTVYGLPFNQNKGKTIFACDSAVLDARNTGATYLWNFGQTTQKITVFKDSTYIVKINMGACQITDTVKVKLSKTVLSVKTTEGNCTGAGGSAEITAKSGIGKYRYQWSHNANITSNKAENLPAGNYTVKVFDSLNCPKQITFEIKTPKLVSKVYNNRTVVDCNFTVLDLKNNGSLYKNKGKTTTQNPKITESGTYIFEIDNGECKILDTVNVRLSKLEVDVKQSNPLCVGVNSGSLKLTAKNGIGKTSIRWNDDQTPNLWLRENLSVGTYTALITDSVGCQISKTFVIESPAKALTAQAEVKGTIGCFGENNGEIRIIATGGLPPYSYSLNNQKVDSYIKNLANGIFLITVQDSNKCSFVLKVLMYQSDAMKINQIVKNSDCADSNNGSISIKINGGKSPYKVEFAHGVSTVLQENETFILDKLAPRPNVPYEALITDAVGCTQNISAKITVASRSKISVSAEKNSFCEGYGTDLIFKYEGKEKVFPFSVTYSNGKETKTLTNQTDSLVRVKVVPTQNTIYSIEKLAYGNGCEGIVNKTTVNLSLNSLPVLQNVLVLPVNCNSKDGQIIVDPKQIEKGKAPFYFSIDGKNFQESDTFKNLEVGTYTLLIKDQNTCIYQYPQSLQIVDKPCGINPNAIANRFTPNNDGKNDTFEIPELRNYPDCMVTITDRNGIVVFKSDIGYPKAWDGTNNGAKLPSLTTYYYTIELRKGNTKPIFGFVDLIE